MGLNPCIGRFRKHANDHSVKKHNGPGPGVCGSVLQRICKENGTARWPYRKVTSGKSLDKIIEEGLKELAFNLGAYKTAEKQPTSTLENTSGTPVATPASISTSSTPIESEFAMKVAQSNAKRPPARQQEAGSIPPSQPQKPTQKTVSAAQAKSSAVGNTPPHRGNQQSTPSHRGAHAPSPHRQKSAATLDDFKTGFPARGLRRASTRWWGSSEKDSATGGIDTEFACQESSVDNLEGGNEVTVPTASSLLVRTRRRASLRGQSSIAHAVTRGYGIRKLEAKDAATLKFVLGEFLPKQWSSAFPPIP